MKKIIYAYLLLTTVGLSNSEIIAQHLEDNPTQYVWDLSSLYANEQEWLNEVNFIQTKLKTISDFKGKAFLDSNNMLAVLKNVSDLRQRAAKLVIYGALIENLDITSEAALSKYETALKLEDKVESAIGFVNYDVDRVSMDTLQLWYKTTPKLSDHRKRIERIKYQAKHLLNEETEASLKSLSRLWSQSGDTHQTIMESELGWPKMSLSDSTEATINLQQFYGFRKNDDRQIREQAVSIFLNHLKNYEDILKIQLTKRIDKDLQLAKLRGFPTGPDADFFFRDGFPSGTAETFINAAQKNKKILQRFVKILGKIDNKSQYSYADIYVQSNLIDRKFSLKESIDIVFKGTKFLGKDYQNKLKKVLTDSILHLGASENKRNMWAIYPPIGNAKPYTIMKYNDSFLASNVFMRAMVGNLAQFHFVADTRDDPPVYNNAIIYVGSLLHYDYLIKSTSSDEEKLFFLLEATKRLWNSFYKYAIYATFENEIEKRLASNSPPGGHEISNIYYKVLKEYFGDEIHVPEIYKYEWMTIGQPFSTYEHQYWPAAMAAACNIIERLDSEEKIKDLLVGKTNPRSDRSFQILNYAGINMNEEGTYDLLFTRMNNYLDQIVQLLVKKENGANP